MEGFSDVAGTPLTPSEGTYSSTCWPVCNRHDYEAVVTLPHWWKGLREEQRVSAREADYYARGVVPGDVAISLSRAGVAVVHTSWQSVPTSGEWFVAQE